MACASSAPRPHPDPRPDPRPHTGGLGPVVVVGSLNMDLVLRVGRMPGPGETTTGEDLASLPGGKGANQAVAAARLGAPVALVGRVGTDAHARTLLDGLRADGVDCRHVSADPAAATGVALIVVEADGQNRIVLAAGANARLEPAAVDAAGELIAGAALLVLQLEVPLDTVLHAALRARAAGVPVLLNAAPARALPESLWAAVDLLVVNEVEAALLAGEEVVEATDAARAAEALRRRGPGIVIVTLGGRGVVAADAAGTRALAAHDVPVVDTTAAGDAFIGALAAAWREGCVLAEALAWGQGAGALCVTRRGARPAIPWRHELESFMKADPARARPTGAVGVDGRAGARHRGDDP